MSVLFPVQIGQPDPDFGGEARLERALSFESALEFRDGISDPIGGAECVGRQESLLRVGSCA